MVDRDDSLPEPVVTVETGPFWQAANEGRLLFGNCHACNKAHYYPRAVCPHCLGDDVEWMPASGGGRVHSFSVARKGKPPYVIAYVTLDEGVSVLTNLIECEAQEIAIDQPVELVFRKTPGGQAVPLFRPAAPRTPTS